VKDLRTARTLRGRTKITEEVMIIKLIKEIQSEIRSAAEKREQYNSYQRFFKLPPYENNSILGFIDFSKWPLMRTLTALYRRLYAYWCFIGCSLRKGFVNRIKMRMLSGLKGEQYRKNL